MQDLPKIWKEKYKEYLNVDCEDDKNGVLQDIHWSAGYFGYFPSYLLSGIYAAQIAAVLNKDLGNITENINTENLKIIHNWLKENIHRYGAIYTPSELIEKVSGKPINSIYYIEL